MPEEYIAAFNPLDKVNLGRSVAEAMLEREVRPLGKLQRFTGAGIYALYYTGNFSAYVEIASRNRDTKFECPIYVGKAVSKGARKGNFGLDPGVGPYLFGRLTRHAESINFASNLDLGDFYCRFLVVDEVWIPLGEALLIAKFSPIWNKIVDGFGNHNPGKGRFEGLRPRWDVLHPGRKWAMDCKPRTETADQIATEVAAHLRVAPAPFGHMLGDDNEGKIPMPSA